MFTPFDDSKGEPAIHGFLHEPARHTGNAIVLTHGAGANCQSKLLVELSNALAEAGFAVFRFDLPFRFSRPHGPPNRGSAVRDRDGLRRAVSLMREKKHSRVFMGGHSYGGRQATMLAADEPRLVDGLLLLSYPLHPPAKTEGTSHQPFSQARYTRIFRSRCPRPFRHGGGNAIRFSGDPRPARDYGSRRRRPRPSLQKSHRRITRANRPPI